MIVPEIEQAVYRSIRGKLESLGARVFAIGGVEDHVHVAFSGPPTVAISDLVGEVKGASSHHVNHLPDSPFRIKWSRGYGVLSFNRDHFERVVAYIRNQKEHHADTRLWGSLENYGDDSDKPEMVREEHAEYDPFGLGIESPVEEP